MSSLPMLVTQADPARLAQVLDNILLNAVKFSPECAPIEMDVRGDGNTIVVTIVDHGEGMPADELEHIFAIELPVQERGTTDA